MNENIPFVVGLNLHQEEALLVSERLAERLSTGATCTQELDLLRKAIDLFVVTLLESLRLRIKIECLMLRLLLYRLGRSLQQAELRLLLA